MIGEPGRARFDGRSRPPAVPRFLARIVAALVAALLGALTALAAVSGSAEVGSAETVYTYSDHPRSSVLTRAMSERGPPAYDLNAETANDAVDRWSRGAPARSNGPATTTTYTYYRPALAQTTCGGRAAIEVVGDPGMACVVVQPLSVAAKSGTPLYRGVTESHHAFDDALKGTAMPGDLMGHSDGVLHSAGMTENSILTSWTTDRAVAQRFATNGTSGRGVILETTLEQQAHRTVQGLDLGESEVLLRGIVTGCRVSGCP